MQLQVTVGDRTYRLLNDEDLTYAEWLEAEERTGMTMIEFQRAINALSPKAYFTLTMISIRRQNPDFESRELLESNFLEQLQQIAQQAEAATKSEADARPPEPPPSENATSERPAGPETSSTEPSTGSDSHDLETTHGLAGSLS